MKRFFSTILVVLLIIPMFAAIMPNAFAANDYSSYVDTVEIKKGDTLYSICKAKGLSYGSIKEAIMIANGFATESKMSKIEVGQKILIPKTAEDAKKIIELEKATPSSKPSSTSSASSSTTPAAGKTTVSANSVKVEIPANQVNVYTVQSGDTMNKICKTLKLNYTTCKSVILLLNGWTSDSKLSKIYVGEKIKFPVSDDVAKSIKEQVKTAAKPTATTAPAKDDELKYYVVKHTMERGETMKSVSKSLGMTYLTVADKLKSLNGLSDLSKVQAGRSYLFLSDKNDDAVYAVYEHTVVSGDTLYSLCNNYSVKYKDVSKVLEQLNTNTNLSKIKVGQKILLVVPITANETELVIK